MAVNFPRLLALSASLATVLGLMTQPAQAADTGTLGLRLTARYAAGHSGPLVGAQVSAENIDTGDVRAVPAYGDPTASEYYQALGLPFGRYRLRIERAGFATTYWPQRFSPASAGVVTFGRSPGCNAADPAICDIHTLTAEVPQPVTLSGRLTTRAGNGVDGIEVTSTRDLEPTFRPTATTAAGGHFAVAVPPGAYTVAAPNGNSTAQQRVTIERSTVVDLTLHDTPGAPRNLTVATGNRQASVAWAPPADDGGSPVTSYTVHTSPGAASCTTSSTSCTLTDLENGREHVFTVTAENRIGRGPTASAVTTVSAGVPRAPSNVRVTGGDRALEVTWSASPSDGVGEYIATARPGGRSCSTSGLACTIGGLRNGTAYRVTVTARTSTATSPEATAPRRVRPAGTPGAPRDVRVSPRRAALRVAWKPPLTDGGRRVRTYVATAWPGGRTCTTSGALTCRVRGLAPGTAYSVTLRAENAVGTGPNSPGSAPTEPLPGTGAPAKVRGLRVEVRAATITATWRATPGARAYWVRLRPRGGPAPAWSKVAGTRASFSRTEGGHVLQVRAQGRGGLGPITGRRVPG